MSAKPKVVAILLAGGEGRRAGRPKQLARAGGHSILEWACSPFAITREIAGIIIVGPAKQLPTLRRMGEAACGKKLIATVEGGSTRHLSSRAGLAALPPSCEFVLIHDVARPFADAPLIRRVLRAARLSGAAIPAVAVHDSTVELKAGSLRRYLPRESLAAVQTPQAFKRELIEEAFAKARGIEHGDDAVLVSRLGAYVSVVEGDESNCKITTAEQLGDALKRLRRATPK